MLVATLSNTAKTTNIKQCQESTNRCITISYCSQHQICTLHL